MSTPPPSLTGAERRALRGEGQRLEASVALGREGPGPSVIRELERQLARNGLVKVRTGETDRRARTALFAELATATGSALVGSVGRTALYYRSPEDPTQAPAQGAAPRLRGRGSTRLSSHASRTKGMSRLRPVWAVGQKEPGP